jgi:thiamine biosynthesis lipoprotein
VARILSPVRVAARWTLLVGGLAPAFTSAAVAAAPPPAVPSAVAPVAAAPAPPAAPSRFLARAFHLPVELHLLGLEPAAAEHAFRSALAELAEIEKLLDPANPESALSRLDALADGAEHPVDPRLVPLLARAADFCVWSEGAHGPLGRRLYAVWGAREPGSPPPSEDDLRPALAAGACDRLALDAAKSTVRVAPGSGFELRGFAEGFAVDRVADLLKEAGASSGLVGIGTVWRAFGGGPEGKGWPLALPAVPGLDGPPGKILLRDHALAVVLSTAVPPYLNQRTGKPPEGTLAVAALTDRGLDAQGLAVGLFVMRQREGQLRLGSLQPKPSALWWMGSGEGPPLQVHYRWSEVIRP